MKDYSEGKKVNIMTNEYLPFGRDLDEIAMLTDRRSIKDRVRDWLNKHTKQKQLEAIDFNEQKQPQEPLEK